MVEKQGRDEGGIVTGIGSFKADRHSGRLRWGKHVGIARTGWMTISRNQYSKGMPGKISRDHHRRHGAVKKLPVEASLRIGGEALMQTCSRFCVAFYMC